ncbi:MAG: phenylalanine--tRNA ligase subunit alpha [Bacteroidota bacterium]|nr:phenylalanine--tRNA ligase subunit alpha [Bacteroidota bacterium]
MIDKIKELSAEIESKAIENMEQLEAFRLQLLSKKGAISMLFEDFKNVANEQKKLMGAKLNELKQAAEARYNTAKEILEQNTENKTDTNFDFSLPIVPNEVGTRHPLWIIKNRMIEIFERMGFNLSEGPEIEDDFHNFTALNFPDNHPAREMQDTFFVNKNPDILLRTHTSTVQVRLMAKQKPPIRSIMPGRVYRNEAISARAHCFFHQLEGLYINENVSFAELKQTLLYFATEMFSKETKIRLRPSFFPFTEPSAELDISCQICGGSGCNVCKHSGWVEIGGAGMVDPEVLKLSNIDSEQYTGFAFGMGIERITMLKYGIKDLRLFSENDVRFLRQFHSV